MKNRKYVLFSEACGYKAATRQKRICPATDMSDKHILKKKKDDTMETTSPLSCRSHLLLY
jgi:hypothetical protein